MSDQASQPSGEIEALRDQLAATRRQLESSEQERALLARREKELQYEVQHQVRNMLAIVSSVFARTIGSGHPLEDVDSHFRGRLDALARFQVGVGRGPHGGADLESLIRDELRSFEFDDRVQIDGPDVTVPHDVTPLLGLAIHELATNAIKFGALSTGDGRTRLGIRWTCSDGALALHWVERGVAVLAPAPIHFGFGRQFIDEALPYQLAATTTFGLRPGGLTCTLAIDLNQAGAAGGARRGWV